MDVYQWLAPTEWDKWICPHLKEIIDLLVSKDGNEVKAVGLVNYRSPEAIVFMTKPLDEALILPVAKATPNLRTELNGIGALSSVSCSEHWARIEHSLGPMANA